MFSICKFKFSLVAFCLKVFTVKNGNCLTSSNRIIFFDKYFFDSCSDFAANFNAVCDEEAKWIKDSYGEQFTYELKDGGCYNYNARYYADFSGDVPRCNGSDLKYEEIYMGSADIWCAPKGKTIVNHTCPDGYQDTGNNCLKEEIISCN